MHHHHLVEVNVSDLRPTQMTVGFTEVALKRTEWRQLPPKSRAQQLSQHWFPSVLGPKDAYYIVDHHHLAVALHLENIKTAMLSVLADFSFLKREAFWRVMEFRRWCHPYNASGERESYRAIPRAVTELKDDPFRSLAGLVREAGGYAKDVTPFSEFLWADYFRSKFSLRQLKHDWKQSVRLAIKAARTDEARYLPGWCGDSHVTENTPQKKQ